MVRVLLTLLTYFSLYTMTAAQDLSASSACQNIIGTIRNLETDEAIPKAKVALEYEGKIVAKVVTDEHGNYTFKNVNHGLYFIKVALYDYAYTYLDQVEINSCETKYIDFDFDLGAIATLDEVQIIADKIPNPTICVWTCGAIIHAKEAVEPFTLDEELDLSLDEITTRFLPAPSKKDPDEPIKDLSIFPNPSFGQIKIELTFETLQLTLFDMLGHDLGTVPFQQLEDELVSIDLSQLPSGTYALQLKHEEGTDIQKLVILTD